MKCVRCGTTLNINDKFCLGCGFEVGKEYVKNETAETLESLMNASIAGFDSNRDDEMLEELDVTENLSVLESIDGVNVTITTDNVLEGETLVLRKKRRNYMPFIIILIILLVVSGILGIYKYISYLNDLNNTIIKPTPDITPVVKPNVSNTPTSLYSFGNNFIVRVSDLWNFLDKGILEKNIKESKYFITDGATLSLNLYEYNTDPLNTYIENKKINSSYNEVKIKDEKYYLLTFENNKIYVKIINNYLYAFEFFATESIDSLANQIMNNVIIYK